MMYLKFLLGVATIGSLGCCLFFIWAHKLKDFPSLKLSEKLVISFGLGGVGVGVEMFLMALLNIKFSPSSILLFQMPLYLFLVRGILAKKTKLFCGSVGASRQKINLLGIIFALLIFFNIFHVLIDALAMPFVSWDSWCNYGHKAKIFYHTKKIDPALFTTSHIPFPHPDYPPAVPLIEAYIYLFLGTIHEPLAKLWLSFYYPLLILVFYVVLRRCYSSNLALRFAFILSAIPKILKDASMGGIDVVMTFYVTTGILYLWSYMKDKKDIYLFISSIFLGLGMWIKNEALSMYLIVVVSGFFVWLISPEVKNSFKTRELKIITIIPMVIILPWLFFRHHYGVIPDYFKGNISDMPYIIASRMSDVLVLLFFEPLQLLNWNILWYLFIAYTVLHFCYFKEKSSTFFIFIIFFQFLSYFFVYSIWPVPNEELLFQIMYSKDRLLIVLAPIALFFITQRM